MVAQPKHGRKIAFSAVALTMANNNEHGYKVFSEWQTTLEPILIDVEFYKNTPFSWITLVVRYGLKNDPEPEYKKINKKYGDLPLAIEIDVNETVGASFEEMKTIIGRTILKSVIHVGRKYECPTDEFEKMLENLSHSMIEMRVE